MRRTENFILWIFPNAVAALRSFSTSISIGTAKLSPGDIVSNGYLRQAPLVRTRPIGTSRSMTNAEVTFWSMEITPLKVRLMVVERELGCHFGTQT